MCLHFYNHKKKPAPLKLDKIAPIPRTRRILVDPVSQQDTVHEMVQYKTNAIFSRYLNENPDLVLDGKDKWGNTPLHLAAMHNHSLHNDSAEKIKTLLLAGANRNVFNYLGHTPLHEAIRCDKIDYVDALTERNLSLNLKDIDNKAIWTQNDIDAFMITNHPNDNTGNTPIFQAIVFGNQAIINMLYLRGASLLLKNKAGDTPLHMAVKIGSIKVVELVCTLLGQRLLKTCQPHEPRFENKWREYFYPVNLWGKTPSAILVHDGIDKVINNYAQSIKSGIIPKQNEAEEKDNMDSTASETKYVIKIDYA